MPLSVVKIDEDQHLVFGWANVSLWADGTQVIDAHGDSIDPDELEDAAYLFTMEFRETGVMHKGEAIGRLVESFMVTPDKLEKMGILTESMPVGWWVGFYIEDEEAWKSVKEGKYSMFSIQGWAIREEE